ncbi:transposase [Ktedonobacter sp. SOSP1-52]|uniref:ISL3 family transposase n=1 Tax=Ktedonobacter sp. SOSP1-52 TaxID=2778366 RepID=UPI001915DB29|nr:ISL3 family transposase [Ktedonobacter sp. SOSP1-52]GHO63482.1 transposase [Ktedonobacter sp. SOSP1-52]
MVWTDLLPHFPHLQMDSIHQEGLLVLITLISTRETDVCPTCQTHSRAGHGWFTRRIHSLPCSGRAVVFLVQARRFRCTNPTCPRKTFREDLSALANRYQRRTQAATHLLYSLAAIAGGKAGACLARQIQFPASRSTLLRCLLRQAASSSSGPKVVGVDDFAWTKRRRYGTILVDLETHRLLALLADCEGDTVAAWFRQHPSVQIVTRDRSPNFAEAIRRGAPHALHIADRFHLHMNAMTCLETVLTREQATLCRVTAALRAEYQKVEPTPEPSLSVSEQQRAMRRARRYARYEQVVQLSSQGWSQRAIAQEVGIHPQTVAIYLKAGQFPERAPHPPRSLAIQPYLEYLRQRWEQGEHNGRILFKEIRAQGYSAGLTGVYVAIQPWRTHGPTASLARAKVVQLYPSYSPKQMLWLLFKEKPTVEEQRFVQSVLEQSKTIACAYEYVRRFRQILTERDETALHPWAYEAEASQVPELARFVQGLCQDWEAVENALLFVSSQGQVEGQVNRLKVFKRQGYGRANPALLQAQLMGASELYRT